MRSGMNRRRISPIRALSVLVTMGAVLAGTASGASAHRTVDLPSSAKVATHAQPAKATTGAPALAQPERVLTATPNANAYFGMTVSTAGTPNQSALFQVSIGYTGTANRMWIAIPSSMTNGVPIGSLRISTTLPGGSLSYIGGGIPFLFSRPAPGARARGRVTHSG